MTPALPGYTPTHTQPTHTRLIPDRFIIHSISNINFIHKFWIRTFFCCVFVEQTRSLQNFSNRKSKRLWGLVWQIHDIMNSWHAWRWNLVFNLKIMHPVSRNTLFHLLLKDLRFYKLLVQLMILLSYLLRIRLQWNGSCLLDILWT